MIYKCYSGLTNYPGIIAHSTGTTTQPINSQTTTNEIDSQLRA